MTFKVLIFSDLVLSGQDNFELPCLLSSLAKANVELDELKILKFDKALIKESITSLECKKENLLIFCANDYLDEILIENISKLGNDKTMIDSLAVIFKREQQYISFIPLDLDWQKLLDKIIYTIKQPDLKYCKFHLFGINPQKAREELEKIKTYNDTLKFNILGKNLLTDIFACYEGGTNLIDDEQVKIASIFRDNLYSENDLGLSQIVYEMLRLKNFKIAISETITGGKILASLFEGNENFQEVLKHGEVTNKIGEIIPQNIYNDAVSLLKTHNCDIVLDINGKFDEKGLNCIFAIGDKTSVHVYKNRFNANREDCLEMATNCALFHLVKKLRQNDFSF